MMLDRLRSQCEYFLNWGRQRLSILNGNDIDSHIEDMIKYYNLCDPKPQWLSYSQILGYKTGMMRSLWGDIIISV